ncbi:MAG TPA: PGPGW domain-containing protein [Terracidiphilus sp.]|nr:PGPGW domain-containing protein [Terracidiphilus sp.]
MRSEGTQGRGSLWRKIVGWFCIAAGLLGLVLPIIPGIPLLIAGVVTLSTQHRWARALMLWMKRRFRKHWPARSKDGGRVSIGKAGTDRVPSGE